MPLLPYILNSTPAILAATVATHFTSFSDHCNPSTPQNISEHVYYRKKKRENRAGNGILVFWIENMGKKKIPRIPT
jgi:mannitol-1-phosphate/altronate dehydrogenase